MNSIEPRSIDAVAGALFDHVVVPMAAARQAAGAPGYFTRAGDAATTSYFGPPSLAVMQSADFEFPGGGTATGLINALANHWIAQGETELATLAPQLAELAALLRSEDLAGDGTVDIMCYTMF